ncbi:hypothetical protein LCM20_06270 [Halobacillus litoralis]|uniref:hypothetical protein n=1 Tax=Halobacillus litoralis TaxID=45668 RepID=UPI001CD68227|nr:hypothetical protein [Halobacillus litoralis]MCA0970185.1 hypothetical protein [Halobacillus litoralis]
MIFQYAFHDEARRIVKQSFMNVGGQVLLIAVSLYLNHEVAQYVVYASAFIILISLIAAVYNMNITQRDYVRMSEQYFTVHNRIVDPRHKVFYEDVTQISYVENVLSVQTTDDSHRDDIYTDKMEEADASILIRELENRTGVTVTTLEEEEIKQQNG